MRLRIEHPLSEGHHPRRREQEVQVLQRLGQEERLRRNGATCACQGLCSRHERGTTLGWATLPPLSIASFRVHSNHSVFAPPRPAVADAADRSSAYVAQCACHDAHVTDESHACSRGTQCTRRPAPACCRRAGRAAPRRFRCPCSQHPPCSASRWPRTPCRDQQCPSSGTDEPSPGTAHRHLLTAVHRLNTWQMVGQVHGNNLPRQRHQ